MPFNNLTLYNQPVVIDNGSCILKAGFSGEDVPRCMEYSLRGQLKYNHYLESDKSNTNANPSGKDTYIGNKAQEMRALLNLDYIMEHGIVKDWDAMEQLWEYVFSDLLSLNTFEEHPVLITEAPHNPTSNRRKMEEILFEKFRFPAVYVANPAVLSLYSRGDTTGCVLECGDGYCSAVPVYEGFSLNSAIQRIDIGGRELTEQLQLMLRQNAGVSLLSNSERELVRTIKERGCYVRPQPEDNDSTLNSCPSKFKLPDGQIISLGNSSYRIPEILFNPQLINSDFQGVPDICFQAIRRTDIDIRSKLSLNIILAGGSTMFRGFGPRLLRSLESLSDKKMRFRIVAPPERKYTAWIGGSVLTGVPAFSKLWQTRDDWNLV